MDGSHVEPRDLDGLLAWLRSGRPVTRRTDFAVGTAMPGGRLDLCKQALGPRGAELVAEALPHRGPTRHLLMGTDGLGDAGAGTGAEAATASGAETLYLGCNGITVTGACRIADRLMASPGIVRGLWLKRNPLGPEGGRLVGEAVASGLSTVDLVQTRLDAGGLAWSRPPWWPGSRCSIWGGFGRPGFSVPRTTISVRRARRPSPGRWPPSRTGWPIWTSFIRESAAGVRSICSTGLCERRPRPGSR
ncbi:hypothetical protein [Streptosporangium vulgare]|uniref:Uncharacterized protein n=1 Tax=Streptosporangium vulgare TaxID=46190 RepID=A0ABV5T4W9_9ACTN